MKVTEQALRALVGMGIVVDNGDGTEDQELDELIPGWKEAWKNNMDGKEFESFPWCKSVYDIVAEHLPVLGRANRQQLNAILQAIRERGRERGDPTQETEALCSQIEESLVGASGSGGHPPQGPFLCSFIMNPETYPFFAQCSSIFNQLPDGVDGKTHGKKCLVVASENRDLRKLELRALLWRDVLVDAIELAIKVEKDGGAFHLGNPEMMNLNIIALRLYNMFGQDYCFFTAKDGLDDFKSLLTLTEPVDEAAPNLAPATPARAPAPAAGVGYGTDPLPMETPAAARLAAPDPTTPDTQAPAALNVPESMSPPDAKRYWGLVHVEKGDIAKKVDLHRSAGRSFDRAAEDQQIIIGRSTAERVYFETSMNRRSSMKKRLEPYGERSSVVDSNAAAPTPKHLSY
eukprot:CAMPEP_0194027954 /NCGR_PEP_ID=MMETSP0009_2-20130614/1985_1 /TAXON_ID=210454 /ORGANISM="Grammatophora oceanica, Strain CCMP 410" /LENGTH=402 /DNA_ID=CAMNT_0038667167 /DNA_START=519 /DNA_END=1727 /DNA_ORIENTATION=-